MFPFIILLISKFINGKLVFTGISYIYKYFRSSFRSYFSSVCLLYSSTLCLFCKLSWFWLQNRSYFYWMLDVDLAKFFLKRIRIRGFFNLFEIALGFRCVCIWELIINTREKMKWTKILMFPFVAFYDKWWDLRMIHYFISLTTD